MTDIQRQDVAIERRANGTIEIAGQAGDLILISSYANDPRAGIEEIQFADGAVLDREMLAGLPIDPTSVGGEHWNTASDGDDVVEAWMLASTDPSGYVLVDAGGGNDRVFGSADAVIYGGAGNDSLQQGHLLLGGPGDDSLIGGAILVGGEGNDYLEGWTGASRYLVDPNETGVDTIVDSGESDWACRDWYYNSIGIADWGFRREYAGTYVVPVDEGQFVYYSYEEIPFEYRNDAQFIEPLPDLPPIAASDYAALQPLYDADVVEQDALEFAAGIALSDLVLSWGQTSLTSPVSGAPEPYTTLDLSWGFDRGVSIAIPHSSDPIGTGIEQVKFADGTVLGMRGVDQPGAGRSQLRSSGLQRLPVRAWLRAPGPGRAGRRAAVRARHPAPGHDDQPRWC